MHSFQHARETYEDHKALIALAMVPGIGPGRIRKLIAQFGSPPAVFDASVHALKEVSGITESTASQITTFDRFDLVADQFRRAESIEATLLPFWHDAYPELLGNIYDPPAFLWVRGSLKTLSKKALAIVGTRKPSAYGVRAAAHFARSLAEAGFIIVSGLAYGIDAAAHHAALESAGESVAVLGSGIDRIYPARHTSLARNLMAQGAVVSEFLLRSKPDAVNFPKRNRIISGLTLGTIVIEAFEKGGALITARLAVEQNREVFAVPGSVFNATSTGCHQLVKSGQAKLVHNISDVLEELKGHVSSLDPNGAGSISSRANVDLESLGLLERKLYEILNEQPMHIDQICHMAGLDTSTVLVYLLNLEFKGLVYQLAGKQFYRV